MAANAIFVSYRRDDVPDAVGRIFDRLVTAFGPEAVFKDVDTLPVGVPFDEYIIDVLSECRIVLAVIGTNWLDARTPNGTRRLDMPEDWVRAEIAAGLRTDGITVIPVLHAATRMPQRDLLPSELVALGACNAAHVRHDPDFHRDMDRLIEAINLTLREGGDREPPLRRELQKLKTEKDLLETRMREDQLQRDIVLAEVVAREKEALALAESRSREVLQLRREVEEQRRESSANAAAKRALEIELDARAEEAHRVRSLAEAEAATRLESQTKALADLAESQNQKLKREEDAKLERLIEAKNVLDGNDSPIPPTSRVTMPKSDSDPTVDQLLKRDRTHAEAREIASRTVRTPLPRDPEIAPTPGFERLEPQRKTNSRRARSMASRLARLEPSGDVALAMHHATQIERQQVMRLPILVDDVPAPPLGSYEDYLPARPRVIFWHVSSGDFVEPGDPLVDVLIGDSRITIRAHGEALLLSQLVEVGDYVPTSGVIGYLHPR